MDTWKRMDRRRFLHATAVAAGGSLLFKGVGLGAESGEDKTEVEAGVSPAEACRPALSTSDGMHAPQ